MLKGGYTGKILRVNLTTEEITKEEISEETAKKFIGGTGFGLKYLLDEVDPKANPLGEDNKMYFASGPLSGTKAPCASRIAVVTKSPLTGAVGMALSGGYFPVELKFAGYDMLIVEGKSEEPSYIYIKDDIVRIKSAKKMWGMNTLDTQRYLKHELDEQNARIACIGPAGENLSKMACIINEKRAFGRKGVGAVMGSKNLKAISIRGTNEVKIAHEEAFEKARKEMLSAMKDSPVLYSGFSKLGTPMIVDSINALGIFPSENYKTTGVKDYTKSLGAEKTKSRQIAKEPCYGCPVGCAQLKLAQGNTKYVGKLSDPEYETYYSFGGVTGVENIDSVIAADYICDEVGLDTMSTGVTIAFAMELYEKGLLTKEDTGGRELNFGNHELMVDLITEIAYRKEGLGEMMADGTKVLAEKIGQGSEKFAMNIKGLELPAYDPRGAKAHGLNYATSYTGADHNRGYAFQEIFSIPVPKAYDRFAIKGKGELTKWNQDVRAATCDCATMCAFLLDMAVAGIALENTANLVNGASGLDLTPEDVKKTGERVNNLARIFNINSGFTRSDDTFPERILTEPIKGGESEGQYISREDLNLMLDEYYKERNWSEDGVPTKEKLEELEVEYLYEKLK